MSDSENLAELLELVEADSHLALLLEDVFDENSILGRLLMVNRAQLFPSWDHPFFELKLIFWDNYRAKETTEKSVIDLEQRLRKIESKQSPVTSVVNFEQLMKDMRDLITYYFLKAVRANADLKDLVDIQDFNFLAVKRTVRDYESIVDTLRKIADELSDVKSIPDENVRKAIEKLKLGLMAEALGQILKSSSVLAYSTQALPLFGQAVKESLMRAQGLTGEEYTAAIDYMHMLGLFEGCQSIFWCENCRDIRQIYWSLSMIDPRHANMACLRCGKPMPAAIAYRPKESVIRCVDFKDGFLTVAIAHLLKKRNIQFQYSVKGTHERDFVCERKTERVLLECKMHRTDTSERGIQEALKKDIAQLTEHSKIPLEEGSTIVRAVLVCNYSPDIVQRLGEPILESANAKDAPPLSMVSYQDMQELLKELG